MKKVNLTFTLFLTLCSTLLWGQEFDIYVSDAGGFQNPVYNIFKYDENGENGEIFISENLGWPQDIVFLEDENTVLISNLTTGRITKYNADSGAYLSDFATGIGGPTRMKIGDDGLLYVLQWSGNGKVFRYELDGTFVDEFTSLGVTRSIGMDWDADGNFYVSSYTGFIQKFDAEGQDLGIFINSNLVGPTNIYFEENGDLIVFDYNVGNVKRFNSDGEFQGIYIPGLAQPEGIDFYPNGDFLIANGGTSSIKRYDSEGNFLAEMVPSGSAGLILPNAVILREQSTNSTTENSVKEALFVTPNLGNKFSVHTSILEAYQTLTMYDSTGKSVKVLNLKTATAINAAGLAEGIYFITGDKNGVVYRQRIVVKH